MEKGSLKLNKVEVLAPLLPLGEKGLGDEGQHLNQTGKSHF